MKTFLSAPKANLLMNVHSGHIRLTVALDHPQNYRSRGFVTSAPFGITAHESVGLPAPECLMVKELVPSGLTGIQGTVCYSDYECLR